MSEKLKIQALKDLAEAYELAQEFDYCPDSKDEAEEFLGRSVRQAVIDNYSGNRADEIARMIVQKVREL